MARNGRRTDGTFAPGNPGGPGRPSRLVERDYLVALSDAVPLDDWAEIVGRAVADAKTGDAAARAWLAKHLLPPAPGPLYSEPLRGARSRALDALDDLAMG